MKIIFTLFCLSFVVKSYAQSYLSELRTSLDKIQSDKEYAFNMYKTLSKSSLNNLEKGYYGVVESLLANHTFDPMKKISYFNSGKSKLENAIIQLPSNTELRYLRLMLQLNVPSLLGYSSNIDTDRTYIIKNIAFQKNELGDSQYQRIIENLIFNGKCTENQITQLQKLKSE